MPTKRYHIAIIGDSLQTYIACCYLTQELRRSNIQLTAIQLPNKGSNSIRHAFTPFTPILSPILNSKQKTPFDHITIKTQADPRGMPFNFSDYGQPSAAVNFHQAYERSKQHDHHTAKIGDFLKTKNDIFGITYNQENIEILLRQLCTQQDIYTICTDALTVTTTDGAIEQISTQEDQLVSADLYIDCSSQQVLMKKLQDPVVISKNNIPYYHIEKKVEQSTSPVNNHIISSNNNITSCLQAGTTIEKIQYSFNEEKKQGAIQSMYFTQAWKHNCISLGKGYCQLPELLICTDRILESQLLALAPFLPMYKHFSSAQAHYSMHSKRVLDDAIDSTNFLIQEAYNPCELTSTNTTRKKLFESSGASHQREPSMINSNCWGALMRSVGITPKTTNALAQARSAASISQKVNQLLIGENHAVPSK
ncbi:tryptophan 7-halogenase [Marinagarivorans algicola]|uniref:tryptophan 7-halogenase n=1 Tax=Marinagarivorans algicola TaxID=1513270 RepID=UPI0037358F7F